MPTLITYNGGLLFCGICTDERVDLGGAFATHVRCCCENVCVGCGSIPDDLVVEIRNVVNCSCANDDVEITRVPGTQTWEGSGSFCGHAVDLVMTCEDDADPSDQPRDLRLYVHMPDGCNADFVMDQTWTCPDPPWDYPLPFEPEPFLPTDLTNDCCDGGGTPMFTVRAA